MKKKILRIGLIALAVFVITLLLQFVNAFQNAEFFFYDSRMKKTADKFSASEDIILVLLDQASLDYALAHRNWTWPFPREAYAELVDFVF